MQWSVQLNMKLSLNVLNVSISYFQELFILSILIIIIDCDDLTCENPKPTYCKRMCMPRCLCEEGYVRNQDNACVKFEECPAIQRKFLKKFF